MGHRRSFRVVFVVILGVVCARAPALGAEAQSASYVLHQATTNAGGADAGSAGYRLEGSLSQRSVIGTSSSPAYVLQSGFWSHVGSGLVPVWLTVDRNAVTPGNVDLDWSGNNAPYDVYQSTDCTNVHASWFDSTGANSYDDIAPPAAALVCYSVLATAPGPAPPPQ